MISMPDPQSLVFAAAYIRVSTDDQAELSPESQLVEIQKYCKTHNLILLSDHVYIDAGISGKKADRRPEFQRMIAAAKSSPPFSVLLVWKFSRFARNQEESIFYKSILRSKCGVDVVSISEPLIAGPFGSLIERIIEWMDEFYSIRLSQEVKRSMTVNAQKGKLQSTPSFGYRVENGNLVPVPEEAAIVREIFERFSAGQGYVPISRSLNARGIRTHRGNPFEGRTIEYIIRNPVYIGKLRWNPAGRTRRDFFNENIILSDSTHQPLVSQELFDAANQRMNAVKAQYGYKSRPTSELKHWLSGVIRCASCGTTLIYQKATYHTYFVCNNYVKGRCEHSQRIDPDLLEEAILSRLEQDASTSIDLIYHVSLSASPASQQLSSLQASMRNLQSKKSRLQDAYLSGVIDLDDFSKAKSDLDRDIDHIRFQISQLNAQTDPAALSRSIRSHISEALTTFNSPHASLESKNNAFRALVDRCTYNKEANLLTLIYRANL